MVRLYTHEKSPSINDNRPKAHENMQIIFLNRVFSIGFSHCSRNVEFRETFSQKITITLIMNTMFDSINTISRFYIELKANVIN